MKESDGNKLRPMGRAFVILLRIIVGLTFAVSGWAKSIDPWGFVYKIDEYLSVWGIELPRELVLTGSITLSLSEFSIGVLIMVGAMRRSAVWIAAIFMAFMLPLTGYIFVANPVSDCGCFGELFLLSNTATFVKNIILTILIVFLLKYNNRLGGLYAPGVQWLLVVGCVAFGLVLSFYGYRYQPLVDFRPYPTGSVLYEDIMHDADGDADNDRYIYEHEGEIRSFALDELPDSTWTYVGAEINQETGGGLAVTDGNEDVTADVLDADGEFLLLAVSDPGIHYLTRARLANELAGAIHARGGRMVALVAADGERLEAWRQLALPTYEVYSSDDTSLKELVRGDAGLMFLSDGRIIWKRNMASIRYDVLKDKQNADRLFSDDMAVDDGKTNLIVTLIFILWMMLVYSLNFPNRFLDRYFERHSQKK